MWLACSGGLDSMVLLQLAARAASSLPVTLRVIHVHHGVHPAADAWLDHCQRAAEALSLPFVSERLPLQSLPHNDPENTLRNMRYAVLSRRMGDGDVMLTAHHQDDQAETILQQLLRGAGPKGLSAMPVIRPFGGGFHGRPLLDVSRRDLKRFAEAEQLTWVEDSSNADRRFSRNYLRHDVLPLLEARWPSAAAVLARAAANCADAEQSLAEYQRLDLAQCAGGVPGTLSVKKLQALPTHRAAGVLRQWIVERGFVLPARKKLQQLQQDMLLAGPDRLPCAVWRGAEMRRYRDTLYLMAPLSPHDPAQVLPWDGKTDLVINHLGRLSARAPLQGVCEVRFRQGGEVCLLPGRQQHHALKKIFQEQGIPPWIRDRIPLVYVDGQLVAAVGVFGIGLMFTPLCL